MITVPENRCFKSIREFHIIQEHPIGSGSFGVVQLARHRSTSRMYAIKVVTSTPSETEARLIEREVHLHSQVDHPHLIKLWDTLLEDGSIYMVMEYAEGGNLFYHQNTKNIFSEQEAFRFFTQTLQAVSYLHRNQIIHRDLKPENILLDSEGNVKICDFGWAARDLHSIRNTFCGTYQYMAPQMLFRGEYDYRVDIWALGVLLYEMLHGYAPYKGKTAVDVQDSMMNGDFEISPRLSDSVQNLISLILQTNVDKRLSLQQIAAHPWMIRMEKEIESYLSAEKARNPKQVNFKISQMGTSAKLQESQHRKNGSLNIEATKNTKRPRGELQSLANRVIQQHLSQGKQTESGQEKALLKTLACSNSRKGKTHLFRAQNSEGDLQQVYSKIRNKKSIIDSTQFCSMEKSGGETPFCEVQNKRKVKNNRSDVDMLAKKYPVRYVTEVGEGEGALGKLKKSHANGKLLGMSRSAFRFQRGRIQLQF